jgi:hypothetical protein
LITHAKPRDGLIDKQFSKRNRPPDELVDFFDYSKTRISYNYGSNGRTEELYIHLPNVIDISTEREIGNSYLFKVRNYIENETRIIDRSIRDLARGKKFESHDKLHSSHVDMITTRLNERGIDLDKFKSELELKIQEYELRFEKASRTRKFPKHLVGDQIYKLLSESKELSPTEKGVTGMTYMFSGLRSQTSSKGDNDYTVDGVDLKPLVSAIENLVSLFELEMFTEIIKSKFKGIRINVKQDSIRSGKYILSFSDLSSGERQKFRIFTSIGMQILNTASDILITIDEPEISLHLSWQRQFVDDIISFIGELTSKFRLKYNEDDELEQIVSLIISTHSPTLLANHFHRGQKLGEDDIDG